MFPPFHLKCLTLAYSKLSDIGTRQTVQLFKLIIPFPVIDIYSILMFGYDTFSMPSTLNTSQGKVVLVF